MATVPIFSGPATATILNGFQALPETGNVSFPHVGSDKEGSSELGTLTRETEAEFRLCVRNVLEDAGRILSDKAGRLPFYLKETGGEWRINEYAAFSPELTYAQMVHNSGRFVFLANLDSRTEVFVGTAAHGVLFSVANAVCGEGLATLFQFAFFDVGVKRLRTALRLEREPLFMVAMSLANTIARSDQYTVPSLSPMSLCDLGASRLYSLNEDNGMMDFDEAVWKGDLLDLKSLELTCGGRPDESGGVHFQGAMSNDGREYLAIALKDDKAAMRGQLMPLKPSLQMNLWDLAMILGSGAVMGRS